MLRKDVLPLLEAAGLDLLISGHSHSYERSKLMRAFYSPSQCFNSSSMVVDDSCGCGAHTASRGYIKPSTLVPFSGFVATVVGSSGKTQKGKGVMLGVESGFESVSDFLTHDDLTAVGIMMCLCLSRTLAHCDRHEPHRPPAV
jgi:hypothetical protein